MFWRILPQQLLITYKSINLFYKNKFKIKIVNNFKQVTDIQLFASLSLTITTCAVT